MTLLITSIQSATYNEHGTIEFIVTCGDMTDIPTKIFNNNRPKDQQNDAFLQAWLDDGNSVSPYVSPDGFTPPWDDDRRKERRDEFANTIDKLNPIQYNSLSSEKKSELEAWRQEWLDYPNDETNTKPLRIEGIF